MNIDANGQSPNQSALTTVEEAAVRVGQEPAGNLLPLRPLCSIQSPPLLLTPHERLQHRPRRRFPTSHRHNTHPLIIRQTERLTNIQRNILSTIRRRNHPRSISHQSKETIRTTPLYSRRSHPHPEQPTTPTPPEYRLLQQLRPTPLPPGPTPSPPHVTGRHTPNVHSSNSPLSRQNPPTPSRERTPCNAAVRGALAVDIVPGLPGFDDFGDVVSGEVQLL